MFCLNPAISLVEDVTIGEPCWLLHQFREEQLLKLMARELLGKTSAMFLLSRSETGKNPSHRQCLIHHVKDGLTNKK